MEIALIIFSSVSVTVCLFVMIYFLFIRKENTFHDISLGLLFLALAFRISKSIVFFIFSDIDTIGVALGFLGFTSVGPFLLLYFNISVKKVSDFTKKDILHFVYPFLGFITINLISGYDGKFYLSGLISLTIYALLVAIKFIFNKKYIELVTEWHKALFISIFGLIISFGYQQWGGSMQSYTIGTAMAGLVVYVLFFYVLKSPVLIKRIDVAKVSQEHIDRVVIAIEIDEIYREQAITLVRFSEIIKIPSYIISKITRIVYDKSFPETINSFRIKDIKEKLTDSKFADIKIESLAFDAGFNTSSAFYTAFKKETQLTPGQFKESFTLAK
tara:strand:- start:23345 stop:24331 length:987 start_codon:yes stop_codon:yes gene_type:complete